MGLTGQVPSFPTWEVGMLVMVSALGLLGSVPQVIGVRGSDSAWSQQVLPEHERLCPRTFVGDTIHAEC